MRESHSLLTMYASAERGRQRPWLVQSNKRPKSQHVVIFQSTEKTVAVCSLESEHIIWDAEETHIPNHATQRTLREKKKVSRLNEFALRGLVGLVKWNTQRRRLVHEERDNY